MFIWRIKFTFDVIRSITLVPIVHGLNAGELLLVVLLSPKTGRKRLAFGSESIKLVLQFNREMKISLQRFFFHCFRAFFM